VAKLFGSDEYSVEKFLNVQVTNLRFREDFTDEIHRPLHTKCMAFLGAPHHDGCADGVSSRGDVEE
jgi:hypothetical protein